MRRKPNIILVGEARDRETVSAAIEAGQTGHLVFSTLHTIGVAATVPLALAPGGGMEAAGKAAGLPPAEALPLFFASICSNAAALAGS